MYRDIADKIHFIEQVILKVEWRRIKDETEKGEPLGKEDIERIFEEVAGDLRENLYQTLKKEA